jgi:hypothetical protein
MITAQDIYLYVFSKKHKDIREQDEMRGGRKTSRSDIDFAVQMYLAWDLENILNARPEKLPEVLDQLKKKYNR